MANFYFPQSTWYDSRANTMNPQQNPTAARQSREQHQRAFVQAQLAAQERQGWKPAPPPPAPMNHDEEIKKLNVDPIAVGDITRVTGSCGIGVIYSHRIMEPKHWLGQNMHPGSIVRAMKHYSDTMNSLNSANAGGCGFLLAAFIDTPECKAMYKFLKERHPILYKSDVRVNLNSGNRFFFCIFDTGEKNTDHLPGQGFENGVDW